MNREFILAEIRRTAAANGGIAPGWRRFRTETGIKTSDWLGKYWARWNDAVVEAGLTPNQMTAAFEDDELLEKYAAFVMEIGRLPTNADILLKANNDSDFPSEKTYRKFGTKSELVRRLAEYGREREDYEDVVALCEAYSPRIQDVPSDTDLEPRDFGYVYLMKSGRYYKIGRTNSVGRREYELAIQLPEQAETVHVIQTDDPVGIEEYWHKRFDGQRMKGEWFDLSQADIKAFKRRKFM